MSSTGEIRIVYAYLETMSMHMSTAHDALDDNSTLSGFTFTGNPCVEGAYNSFLGEWDKHRGTLRDGLGSTRDAFSTTAETFEATDVALVDSLNGEGEGSTVA